MQRVGPYQIPFPYAPYPLQEHAMTALRDFLEGAAADTPPHWEPSLASSHDKTSFEAPSAPATPVTTPLATSMAVLESPTGTGKSQMLLNSVLSYRFEPIYPAESTTDAPCRATPVTSAVAGNSLNDKVVVLQEGNDTAAAAAATPPSTLTLEEVLKRCQLEEEMDQVRRERKARVKAQRRQLRKARKLMRLQQQQQQGKEDAGEEFLLAQDPVAWCVEQQSSLGVTSSTSSRLLSSSSSSADSEGDDDDDGDDADVEGALEVHLATMMPLRKPKVYFASRTHTQLQQLMEDLQRTAFARYPLRLRVASAAPLSSSMRSLPLSATQPAHDITSHCPPSAASPLNQHNSHDGNSSLHRLTAVHVAGRPHLCLNTRLQRKSAAAGGTHGSDMLNLYCTEAMQYERSKQGRADRRRRQQQQQAQHRGLSSAVGGDSARDGVRDVEDYDLPFSSLGGSPWLDNKSNAGSLQNTSGAGEAGSEEEEDRGCVYCAESHLRALMEYVKEEQRAQLRADQHRYANGGSSGGGGGDDINVTPSTSIYTIARLRHLGNELQACPYLATRLLLRGADVAFIPYSYLLDEDQRAMLLGGVTTNPATAAEAEVIGLQTGCDLDQDASVNSCVGVSGVHDGNDGPGAGAARATALAPSSSTTFPATSLGAVLYHRRQRVTAMAAFRQRRKQQQQQQQQSSKWKLRAGASAGQNDKVVDDNDDDEDELWHVIARSAPPSFRGDILVFDEAHNVADHCRATSTVTLAPWHLRLTEGLCHAYLQRYEQRLLTRNKQRLRELILFLARLSRFCGTAATSAAAAASTTTTSSADHKDSSSSSACATTVYHFHTFLFEAGIDSVDVYSLLMFLVDSQLPRKLQGFVEYCVEAEKRGAAAAALVATPAAATAAKRPRASADVSEGGHHLVARQRPLHFLDSFAAEVPTPRHATPHSITGFNDSNGGCTNPTAMPVTSLLHYLRLLRDSASADGAPPTTHLNSPLHLRAVAAEALQRVERLLSTLYISNATSTRVLVTPSVAEAGAVATRPGDCVLKIIQLEPGTHTFAPLAREARAVVLAGGTMQPLAFTCGPLLPPCHDAVAHTAVQALGDRGTADGHDLRTLAAATPTGTTGQHGEALSPPPRPSSSPSTTANGARQDAAASLPVRLISEGHVVPPTSVRVFTLGAGPSAVRMEFTQSVLGDRRRLASAATGTVCLDNDNNPVHRMFAEVGCTLLNLARVLPPAGVICFFTSYDAMEHVVALLQTTGYFDQINAVKRVFCEVRGGKGRSSTEVLRQYQRWIYHGSCDDASRTAPTSTTLTAEGKKEVVMERRGAMLFAVMGGRLSEGINFADDLGRAVIVLGMPYANPTDVELQLNLCHIAATRLRGEAAPSTMTTATGSSTSCSSSSRSSAPFTSAAEWGLYMDGMMRTVNQCIGRCIRHSGDYAVIILLDARYGDRADVRRRVSAWLQPSLHVCRTFGECFAGVRTFFADRRIVHK